MHVSIDGLVQDCGKPSVLAWSYCSPTLGNRYVYIHIDIFNMTNVVGDSLDPITVCGTGYRVCFVCSISLMKTWIMFIDKNTNYHLRYAMNGDTDSTFIHLLLWLFLKRIDTNSQTTYPMWQMSVSSGCSEEWAIIVMAMIWCISEQLLGITCNKHCFQAFILKNKMSTISNCYQSVFWLQSHMLPFGGIPRFWNPVPGQHGRLSRMCADPGCHDHMVCPAELSEALSSAGHWFVKLAYGACFTDLRNPDVNSSAVIKRQYRTFYVIKLIATEYVLTQRGVHGSKYDSRRQMDSRNSKTIEQRHSDLGRRLRDNRECTTDPDLDPNYVLLAI